jgi:hypothetical protein
MSLPPPTAKPWILHITGFRLLLKVRERGKGGGRRKEKGEERRGEIKFPHTSK